MTEWSDNKTKWDGLGSIDEHPEIFGIDNGIFWAERIWRDLTKADVNAWMWWWIFDANWYGENGNDSLKVNEGLVVTPSRTPKS